MDPFVLALVLLAALLHASWNALLKAGGDPFVRLAMINLVGGLCALPLLPLAAVPATASWPYLSGSVATHLAYSLCLAYGYRFGDLSHVYPIARGSAPPLVALAAVVFAGERPGPFGTLGLVLISAAIASLAFDRGLRLVSMRPLLWALATGVAIGAYTVCDGLGGRAAGDVLGYILWLFALNAIPFTLLVAYRRRHRIADEVARNWRGGVLSGALSLGAYGLVIWAMSITPMAHVAALRETSVLIAAWFGSRLLAEPFGTRRMAAAGVIAAGVVLLQTSGAH